MRVPSTSPLAVTYALLDAALTEQALAALAGRTDSIAIDGLLDTLELATKARGIVTAIELLRELDHPAINVSLVKLLRSPWPSVQGAAVAAIQHRGFLADSWCHEELFRLLAENSSWALRRDVLRVLAESRDPRLMVAASDPHWRVRHAFAQWCLARPGNEVLEIIQQLLPLQNAHVQGVIHFLRRRLGLEVATEEIAQSQRPPIWDDDPAVLERLLREESKRSDPCTWTWLPQLVQHDEECVHRRVCELLLKAGEALQLADAANALNEPRQAAYQPVVELFARIDRFRCAEVVSIVLSDESATPGAIAWAIDNSREAVFEVNRDYHVFIRRAIARSALRRGALFEIDQLRNLFGDEDAEVRLLAATALANRTDAPASWWSLGLRDICPAIRAKCVQAAAKCVQHQALTSMAADLWPDVRAAMAEARIATELLTEDNHPQVRAAALTPESATALMQTPERETSWRVLAAACRSLRRPVWGIGPDPAWQPPSHVAADRQSFALTLPPHPAQLRLLGNAKTPVSALALSGHYHLPPEGFAIGVNRGVNLFFWEPNYDTLTAFSRGIPGSQRQQLHFIAGTFEATPNTIRKDAERALRVLHIDRLEVFLLFWTRSWQRLDDAVRRELDQLQGEGIVRMIGLSTHNRSLALEAIDQAWNPVMVRHSAAHRGAEQSIFPAAAALGTSLLAFNSTCYGRLLTPLNDGTRVTAADCYRYTLSHAAVTSCLCAPATLMQLGENLQVLDNLSLDPETQDYLCKVGAIVYQEDVAFRRTLR
jgi:HEAT repeat protein